jgi:hypothetical protein
MSDGTVDVIVCVTGEMGGCDDCSEDGKEGDETNERGHDVCVECVVQKD